ncbi:MAG TPA: NADH-quinone oxidoreductase subunit L [Thermoprotei archaeon]|nr:NADH-quinone oxidoreductase subunit L [Thermoprotei archaeon]
MLDLLANLIWLAPFIIVFVIPLANKLGSKVRDVVAVLGGLLSASASLILGLDAFDGVLSVGGTSIEIPYDIVMIDWFPVDGYRITFGVLLDPLSLFMANVVSLIGSLILIYSIDYMHGDESILRYWVLMNIFIGSMQLLVLGDSFLTLFFGWEGVGFASYALIGYYYKDEKKYWIGPYPPTHAGMKAFITTRIGDIGLLTAIVIIFISSGTLNFIELGSDPQWAGQLAREGVLAITLLLALLGPIGKSAQFPLHEWLPEAMAGPTTVSALIHAATMVKAGVYLLGRVTGILYNVYWGLEELGINIYGELQTFYTAVALIGAFTAFLAASQGMVSDQIKKVLAYSTVSQLGYMFAAFGVAGLLIDHPEAFVDAYLTSIFHLSSHAIFKALLFLSAGAIGHAVGSYLFSDMGGLKRYMPTTFMLMLVGSLSLAGVPPFNGFWSKDAILHAAYVEGQFLVYIILALSAVLTAFYTFRMLGLAFYGKESDNVKHLIEHGHPPHDPGVLMKTPLIILAGASIISGFLLPLLAGYFKPLFEYLNIEKIVFEEVILFKLPDFLIKSILTPLFAVAMIIVVVGIAPAYYIYIIGRTDILKLVDGPLKPLWLFLYNRWYINSIYYRIFVDGLLGLSNSIFKYIESNGGGDMAKNIYISASEIVRRLQTGLLRMNMSYLLIMFVAATALFIVVV